jgi:hypothetical protein
MPFAPFFPAGQRGRFSKHFASCAFFRPVANPLLRRSCQSPRSGWMCDGLYCTSAVGAPQVLRGGIWPFGNLMSSAHQPRSFWLAWCPA